MVTQITEQVKGDKPHYLLFVETARDNNPGHWQFMLKEANGVAQFQVGDIEPGVSGERLDLLTIIRALESLDQPSRVTLTSCSPYIRQGMQYSISEWRENKWQWEFFGYMVPIKHADLWQRMDHLLSVHSVECRQLRMDAPHRTLAGPNTKQHQQPVNWGLSVAADIWLKCMGCIIPVMLRHRLNMTIKNVGHRLIRLRPT
ncbi:MAG: RNase H family protein [Thermoguttaceae bacterium]|jgi:ribonuclease HI